MLIITIIPFLAESGYNPEFLASGAGFWVIWVASLLAFVPATRLSRRRDAVTIREKQLLVVQPILVPGHVTLDSPVAPGLTDSPRLPDFIVSCPDCGVQNLKTTKYCMECGQVLHGERQQPVRRLNPKLDPALSCRRAFPSLSPRPSTPFLRRRAVSFRRTFLSLPC